MKINGKECSFYFSIGASEEIEAMCPEHKLENWGQLFDADRIRNLSKCALALNRASEDYKHYKDSAYEPDYLTEEDIKNLTFAETDGLYDAVVQAMQEGTKTKVKAKPVPGKNAEKPE